MIPFVRYNCSLSLKRACHTYLHSQPLQLQQLALDRICIHMAPCVYLQYHVLCICKCDPIRKDDEVVSLYTILKRELFVIISLGVGQRVPDRGEKSCR